MTKTLVPVVPTYAELHCISNFSFLRGASHPAELIERAQALGYAAIALTDECSLAGVVRAHVAAKECGMRLLIGSEFVVQCGFPFTLVVIAAGIVGYGNLSAFITRLRRNSEKGTYLLELDDIAPAELADCTILAVPHRRSTVKQLLALGRWLKEGFHGRS